MRFRLQRLTAVAAVFVVVACSGASNSQKQQYERWKADYQGVYRAVGDVSSSVPGQSLSAFARHCAAAIVTLNRGVKPLLKHAPTVELHNALLDSYKAEYAYFAACGRNQPHKMRTALARVSETASTLDERIREADEHFGATE
jgi:hypothetical protein